MDANQLMGKALLDYYNGHYITDMEFASNISEKDTYPLPYFFRDFKQMPPIEQTALTFCNGSVLDIGAGSGNHSLYLQDIGVDVTALDNSKDALKVCRLRGIKKTELSPILDYNEATFDTLLLLMNGIGIAQTLEKLPAFLSHLKGLLNPGGQILVDSSDLQYMYERAANGAILVPATMTYYGQLDCELFYKDQKSEPFTWLYVDPVNFKEACKSVGLAFKILIKGDNYDYLAQLTALDKTPFL
jgi:2-polyprenyl-3-methyl-5-hydroxy-6-metoxy-1,4-benzoquinol methylase